MLVSGKNRSRFVLAFFLLIVVAVAGVGVGAVFFVEATPEILREDLAERTVPVTERSFTDSHTVEVSLVLGAESALIAPASGRVTAFSCKPGGLFSSGSTNFSVAGERLVNLATTVPLWRDLRAGDRGEDVVSLHEELVRLGYPVELSDTVSRTTLLSVVELFHEVGDLRFTAGIVPMNRFLWLPETEVASGGCNISTGALVTAGEEIVSLPGSLLAAEVVKLGERAMAGERVLMVDGLSIPVDEEGKITDAAALVTLSQTGAYAQALRANMTSINGSYLLAEPLNVAAVPPGSLYGIEGEFACVTSGVEALRVSLVGSELGQSFVTFPGGVMPDRVDLPPRHAQPCGL